MEEGTRQHNEREREERERRGEERKERSYPSCISGGHHELGRRIAIVGPHHIVVVWVDGVPVLVNIVSHYQSVGGQLLEKTSPNSFHHFEINRGY